MEMEFEKLEEEIADEGVSLSNEARGEDGSIDLFQSMKNLQKVQKEQESIQKNEVLEQKEEQGQKEDNIEQNKEVAENKGAVQENTSRMISEQNFKEFQSKKDREVAEARKEAEEAKQKLQWLQEVKSNTEKEQVNQNVQFKNDFSEPEMPTEGDFLENSIEATRKLYRYERYHEQKQEQIERQKQEESNKITAYNQEHEKDAVFVREKYPEITDINGKLYNKAIEILERDPAIKASPYFESYVVNQAALELGIKPSINNNTNNNKQSNQIKNQKTYIINQKGGLNDSKENKNKDLSGLPFDEWNSAMKKLYSGSNV
jgi:hypothetical protein